MTNPITPETGLRGALAAYFAHQKLTAGQKQEIADLLYKRLGSRACEMCSQVSWAIGDNIVAPQALLMDRVSKTYSPDQYTVFASVHLVCTNCGNTKMFLLNQLDYDPFGSAL
jgi:hypothetical protein